jgi:hypothetical protein
MVGSIPDGVALWFRGAPPLNTLRMALVTAVVAVLKLAAGGFCNKGRVSLGSLLQVALEEIWGVQERKNVELVAVGTDAFAPLSPPKTESAAATTVWDEWDEGNGCIIRRMAKLGNSFKSAYPNKSRFNTSSSR